MSNLNHQRRQAVLLRLDGLKLGEISQRTQLSAPTIISAHKAYLDGGWSAVDTKPPGRRSGDGTLPKNLHQQLTSELHAQKPESYKSSAQLWTYNLATNWLSRTVQRYLQQWGFLPGFDFKHLLHSTESGDRAWLKNEYASLLEMTKKRKGQMLWAGVRNTNNHSLFYAQTLRKKFHWYSTKAPLDSAACIDFLTRLQSELGRPTSVVFKGLKISFAKDLTQWLNLQSDHLTVLSPPDGTVPSFQTNAPPTAGIRANTNQTSNAESAPTSTFNSNPIARSIDKMNQQTAVQVEPAISEQSSQNHPRITPLTHLQRLEAESIHIMREVVAEAENPVMLYSIGKDSAVMLHLAMKAYYPAKPPFPLLHVDTTWKFRAMYEHRDRTVQELGLELLTHINAQGVEQEVNPFTHGSALHTDIMKTQALKQALDLHGFDVAFGGARRDEEKSRAKERVFSFRTAQHRWEPKDQRPELWRLYNTRKRQGESIRVFPLSNWTELDIWQHIYTQNIPIVPLYLAAERPVVERDGTLLMVDDDRMPLHKGEVPMMRSVRFRTLGCYPLTGAVESTASTLPQVIREMLLTRTSERQGRMIDHDAAASMEKKKQEGYF